MLCTPSQVPPSFDLSLVGELADYWNHELDLAGTWAFFLGFRVSSAFVSSFPSPIPLNLSAG